MTAATVAPSWSTEVPDWKDRILNRRKMVPDLPLFKPVAEKALRVFKRLRIPDIHGTPTFGEVSEQWVFDLVSAVFGAYDPETRRRMIREIFLLIPKKNTKTTIAAGIVLTAMILNERPKAEALLVAPTKEVANLAFSQMDGMIHLDPDLVKIFKVRDHIKTIEDLREASLGKIEIKAADTDVVTGAKATYVLIDETHVFAQKSRAAEVFTEIRGALASRTDGFLMQITTQSKRPPAGVFKAELERARAVRDGVLKLPLLAVLYELPVEVSKDGGWKDPETWPLVNPNLGVSVDGQFLTDQLIAAESEGPEAMALLASQHFNVQVGLSLSADRWPGAEFWQSCGDESLTLDELMTRAEVCVVGVDGGGLDDLFALAVLGRDRETRDWLHWAHVWAQPEVFDRRKDIGPQLRDFEKAGDLTVCDYVGQDVAGAVDIIEQLEAAGLLPVSSPAIGLDAYGIAELLDELEERGFDDSRFVSIGQGWKLQQAILTMPRRLKDRRFVHGASAMMAWNVGNAKTELKGSNYIVTKQTAGSAKIDALMATFNASMLMFGNPEAAGNLDDFLADPVMVI